MTENRFFQLNFSVPSEKTDDIEYFLFENGAMSIETNPTDQTQWRVLFSEKPTLPSFLKPYESGAGFWIDSDWQNKWLEDYRGVRFSDSVEVLPWYDEALPPKKSGESICIWLDPRDAFGDGNHATTRQCVTQLEAYLLGLSDDERQKNSLIDIGSGTGLLALLASQRGVGVVHAFDIEPDSVEKIKRNSVLNRCDDVVVWQQDLYEWKPERKYTVVMANLLTQILLETLPVLLEAMLPNGRLILSGMSTPHISLIRERLETLNVAFSVTEEEGWGCFVVKKEERGRR